MPTASQLVYVVDDDLLVRRSLTRLLMAAGYLVESFSSAEACLSRGLPKTTLCVVLDLRMPGLNGLAFQERAKVEGPHAAIVFLTGHGDVPACAKAMKEGAVDFILKPFHEKDLLLAVERALAVSAKLGQVNSVAASARQRLALLTPREQEVMQHVIAGHLNKEIAAFFGTSEKTIKVHRGRVMEKMLADSVPELVRLAQHAGLAPAKNSG